MSDSYVYLLWLFVGVAYTQDAAPVAFGCSRPSLNEMCHNNGTCNYDDGTCQCPPAYAGYDCTYMEDNVDLECQNVCQNGGTCYIDDDNVTSCFCSEAYFGERCQNRRVHHSCSHDGMTIHLTPPSGFEGWVYVLDWEVDPDCIFDKDDKNSFSKEIKFDACGTAAEDTNERGDKVKSFNVLVQFDSMIVTETDLEFQFNCTLRKSGSDIDNSLEPFEYEKKDRPFKKQQVAEELNPVTMNLTTLDDQPVTEPQALGTELKLTFTLNGGEVYDSFVIENVSVTNGQAEPYKQEVSLITNGCVPRRSRIVTQFGGDPTKELTLTFKVFKLRLSDTLKFKTNVRLCKDGGCNATDCSTDTTANGAFTGVGRRRRDVGNVYTDDMPLSDDQLNIHVYTTELKILYPPQWNLSQGDHASQLNRWFRDVHTSRESSCFSNTKFLILMTGISIIVIILVAIVIFLSVRSRFRHTHGDVEFASFTK